MWRFLVDESGKIHVERWLGALAGVLLMLAAVGAVSQDVRAGPTAAERAQAEAEKERRLALSQLEPDFAFEEHECMNDAQCPQERPLCYEQLCAVPCDTELGCPAGTVCVGEACVIGSNRRTRRHAKPKPSR